MSDLADKSHSNNFDFIRFISAVFVVVTHSWPLTGRPENNDFLDSTLGVSFSFLGLRAFFTISGFLIAQSMLSSRSYKNYLWKRSLRIFPGLFIALLFSMVVLGPSLSSLKAAEYFKAKEFYTYLVNISLIKMQYDLPGLFVNNPYANVVNGSIWTLVYEFLMYLGVMVIHYFGALKNKLFLIASFCGMILLQMISTFHLVPNKLLYYFFRVWSYVPQSLYPPALLNFSLYFCAGMILFAFRGEIQYRFKYFILVGLIWLLSLFTPFSFFFHPICLPYLLFYVAYAPSLSFFNNFAKYGDFSYGMYIYAFPIQQTIVLLMGKDISVPAMVLLSLLFTFPLSVLSWHLVEKVALKYKNLIS